MNYLGRSVAAGDVLYVPTSDGWLPWHVSDWRSKPDPIIYGRLGGTGEYEPLPDRARWDMPEECRVVKSIRPSGPAVSILKDDAATGYEPSFAVYTRKFPKSGY